MLFRSEQCMSLQTDSSSDQDELWLDDAAGWHFTNKHDFRIHLLGHHQSTKSHDKKSDIIFLPGTEVQWLVDRQDSSMRMECGLPQDLGCPMPQCASVRFTGPEAWDQRLNHAAEHFLANPQCLTSKALTSGCVCVWSSKHPPAGPQTNRPCCCHAELLGPRRSSRGNPNRAGTLPHPFR